MEEEEVIMVSWVCFERVNFWSDLAELKSLEYVRDNQPLLRTILHLRVSGNYRLNRSNPEGCKCESYPSDQWRLRLLHRSTV